MAQRAVLILTVLALVAGCGRVADSRLNPFNWFGGDREERISVPAEVVARDPRPLVAQVTAISVEQAPGGAILRATGLPPRQGHWDGALLQEPTDPDVLSFQFRLSPPAGATRVSTAASREVVVAVFLSDQTLAPVREIRVLGSESSRSVRR